MKTGNNIDAPAITASNIVSSTDDLLIATTTTFKLQSYVQSVTFSIRTSMPIRQSDAAVQICNTSSVFDQVIYFQRLEQFINLIYQHCMIRELLFH